MKIANDVTELIGNTLLVRLNNKTKKITVEIVLKLEFFNPVQSDHTVRTEKLGVFTTFLRDIESVFKRDPASRSVLEILFCYPVLNVIWGHRISHWL